MPVLWGGQASTACKASVSPSTQAPLQLGQAAPALQEVQRYGKTGQFSITGQKVVVGKPADLSELSGKDYNGKTVAWVYVTAKLVGGDAPVNAPMVMSNVGLDVGNQPATQLILIGDLSSRPSDCKEEDTAATWQKGDSHTMCEPFVFPAGQKPTDISYSQGFYKEPLKWTIRG